MAKKISPIILALLIISCESNPQREGKEKTTTVPTKSAVDGTNENIVVSDRNVYDDIDLFSMKGINKIEVPKKYPYIKIESFERDKKKITYKISAKDSVERNYQLENGYWAGSYEIALDTGHAIIYQYVFPNKIIELDYNGTYEKTSYHLHDATVIEREKMISYGFWGDKGIDLPAQPGNVEIVKQKAKAVFTDLISKNKGILTITTSSLDKALNEIFYSDTNCYKIGDHSWFWWRYFGLNTSTACN